jgi:hypothetical protein
MFTRSFIRSLSGDGLDANLMERYYPTEMIDNFKRVVHATPGKWAREHVGTIRERGLPKTWPSPGVTWIVNRKDVTDWQNDTVPTLR